jgi:23S rRNA pseudouridine1911/1915/1917 synthase
LWGTFLNQTAAIISTTPVEADVEEGEEPSVELELRPGTVTAQLHGQRIDRALVDLVPEFSRSYLQQLIEVGAVTFNGQAVHKASQRVKAGDKLVVELRPTPQSQAFKPEAIALDLVYEDAHILVVNKPAGLVVHPAPGNWSGTLLNALLAHDPESSSMPRAGIVHRLDKDTSGLMVVARSRRAMDALVKAIAARDVSRQYLAIGHKRWQGKSEVTVDAPIGRDPRNRLRMAVVDLQSTAGKLARTDIHLLANTQDFCLVRCVLHTGRTHQIRVHMASIGHPLVADTVYGGSVVPPMGRQALHACRLAFVHPVTGVDMAFEAPVPEDFAALLQSLSLSYNGLSRPLGP